MKNTLLALLGAALLATPLRAIEKASDFTYGAVIGGYSITGYTGPGGAITIPAYFNGQPIVAIGGFAFQNKTSLASVSISINVRNIGVGAFAGCSSLLAITADAGNTTYSSADGVLFNKNQTTLVVCPGGKAGSYLIPNGVNVISPYAFQYCTSLTNITIPGTVTNIQSGAFWGCFSLTSLIVPASVIGIEDSAFDACASLKAFTVDEANAAYSSLDGVLFDKSLTTLIKCPNGKAGSYSIPDRVTSFRYAVFSYCIRLANVSIPGSVVDIGQDAFYDCPGLEGVFFKGNAPNFSFHVFDLSSATVYYLPSTTGWGATFAGRPAVLWNPLMQTSGSGSGVGPAGFGFNVTGTGDIPIVVEASATLANADWVPLQSLNLTNGTFYFSDPNGTNYPARNYRIRSP